MTHSRPPKTEFGVATCETSRGWVGFAWSAHGLAAVTLPEPTEAAALRRLPPAADPAPSPPAGLDIGAFAAKMRRYFQGENVTFDEPLDADSATPPGSEFQRRVWAICRAIPRGQTRTYGDLAREAGSPDAARAVGQAMALNPWPIIVPCHRVVGAGGRLTGYGGGIALKHDMLVMEGAILT